MKLTLVTVSAITVLIANSRGFTGGPKELGRSDKPSLWSESPKLHQTLKKIIPDEPATRDSTNKAQQSMGNALLVPNSARSRQLPELPQLMKPLNINSTTDKDLKERKRKSKMASRSCGGEYTSSGGRIRYPTSGLYQNNENCAWIIRTTKPIRITFVSFSTEYRYDFLYVRDGSSSGSRELGKFHGYVVPNPVQTSGNAAYLKFSSDYSVTRPGFEITWDTIACGGEYTSNTGRIQHPTSGRNYQDNENCAWIIRATRPIKITITRFKTEGRYDFLYIRDGYSSGSNLLGKFHGSVVPSPAQTSGNAAYLHFTSDGSVTSTGFQITWEPHDRGYSPTVRKYAPKLRFDSKFGKDDYCFPSSAAEYYNARRDGTHGRICNRYYPYVQDGRVPTYWKATLCGENLYIAFWFFYGYEGQCCFFCDEHDADWEHIYVKVEKYGTAEERLGPVQFYQKDGWYTRHTFDPIPYEVDGTHPIVYVGKNHHGSYHDDGGFGGCTYYEDFRKPGAANMVMKTWLNLEELDRGQGKPTFMRDETNVNFNGIPQPLNREETNNMCTLKGCKSLGCYRSQYDENTYI